MSPEEEAIINKVIYTSFFAPFILCSLLIAFFIYYQRKRHQTELDKKEATIREQRLIFEKQTALQSERNRIAAEMHDDLGGGLTSIKFLGHRVLKKVENNAEKDIIQKMVTQSSDLIDNMSEIIWAMNSGFDSLPSLVAYIRTYCHKYFGNFEMPITLNIQDQLPSIEVTSQKRRNIFLVVKESCHNIIKHAQAKQVVVSITFENQNLNIAIKDDGIGLINEQNKFGNGLFNMKKRIESISGTFQIDSDLDQGTTINLFIPLIEESQN